MSVGAWQPEPTPLTSLDMESVEKLLDFIASETDISAEIQWISPLAHAQKQAWAAIGKQLSDESLRILIRFFTEQEGVQNWGLGDKSPVIPLFKALKKSTGLDRELVQWVKSHTDNKFLPFGPLI